MNKLNYEILNAIDDIEECTYQAEQDVFNSMINEYQKSMMLLEYVDPGVYDEIIYQESTFSEKLSEGVGKAKGVLSKIWEGIKKAFGLIIGGFRFLINKVVSLFNKSKQTASQVAETIVGTDPQSSGNNVNINNNTVQMDVDSHSKYIPKPIKVASAEGLISKFEKDGSIKISTNFGTKYLKNMVRSSKQKGSGKNAKMLAVREYGSIAGLYVMMYDNNINQKFFNIFAEFSEMVKVLSNKSISKDEETLHAKKLRSIIKDYKKDSQKAVDIVTARDNVNDFRFRAQKTNEAVYDYIIRRDAAYNDKYMKPLTFKLKDIQSFSQKINELNNRYIQPIKLREDIELHLNDFGFKSDINTLFNAINETQYSINAIMNLVSHSFTIDKSYFKTINDPEKLDEFVGALIDAGIPSRYIGYNAWLISGENITSDSEFKPRWGQTRLCLLPNNKDICYKIALSGLGKSGNATEYKIYNEILGGSCDMLCPCLKIYKSNSVVMSKRAEFVEYTPNEKQELIFKIKNNIDKITAGKNIIINDIHDDNIGVIDGKNVVIDYGEFMWRK